MGGEKTTQQSSQQATQTVQQTPEQIASNKLMLEQQQAAQPGTIQAQGSGLNLVNQLLTGQALPGYLNSLPGGIGEDVIGPAVQQSMKDMNTQLAKSGAGTFMESGASQAIGTRAATDMRTQYAQYNQQNLMQLLNQAIGGQAQVIQPINQNSSTLSTSLSRLNGLTSSGQSSGSTIGMNPFVKSFSQSASKTLGSPSFSSFGGMQFGG